jgi:tRNA threonylcarbamoyl adenosine modification protein (Sua5/YciO/YrdC/YwlC family)
MLIEINPQNPQPRLINEIVDVLKLGGIIAYPTDTYYGIGCDIFNKQAIQKIYRLKKQHPGKPFSFICSDLKHISRYAKVSNYAYRTMKRLLPGPYTFVLPGSKIVPKIMITKRKTVGIRVPNHTICTTLAKTFGNPILNTTAATPDGKIFSDPSLLNDFFGGQIDAVIDGGPVPGQPSSIISLINDIPEVIREGLGDVSSFL